MLGPKFKLPPKRLMIFAGLVIAALVGLCVIMLYQQVPPDTGSEVITHSTDRPDENKPEASHKWQGTAEDPKYIKLPSIGAEGFIQKVGIDQNQQVAVPNNIHIAGWFVDSVRPGQTGLSIVDGHVDGRQELGIFKRLHQLKENDEYVVEFGNGSKKTFKVKKVVSVKTKDAANILFSQDPSIKNQLNIITCGGDFNRESYQYEKRVIVISELID